MTLINRIEITISSASGRATIADFSKVLGAVVAPWNSIKFCDFEKVASAFGSNYNTPEVDAQIVELRKEFNAARQTKKMPGHYDLGWKDGQPYLKLIATCDRCVTIRSHSYSGMFVSIHVDFGRGGSASSARIVLEEIKDLGEVVGRIALSADGVDGETRYDVDSALLAIEGMPDRQQRDYLDSLDE